MLGANIDENGGDTPWPQSGEIDILEMYGSRDDGVIKANIHYADKSDQHASMGAVVTRLPEGRFADNCHVFELEWDANSLQWFVDDRAAGSPDDSTQFPQTMYVDWVRVYKPD